MLGIEPFRPRDATSGETSGSVAKNDRCRFCRLYALALAPVFVLLGVLLCAQLALELRQPGVAGQAAGVVLASGLRGVAAAASGSTLTLALVLWAHALPVLVLREELPTILKRGLLLSIPAYLLSFVASGAVCFAILCGVFGRPARDFTAGLAMLSVSSVALGALATVLDAALISFVAWRLLPSLLAQRLSLPGKLVLAITVLLPLRAMFGLVLESLLPG
jgi:hypothetical protein